VASLSLEREKGEILVRAEIKKVKSYFQPVIQEQLDDGKNY
jgi:hypothetical protein